MVEYLSQRGAGATGQSTGITILWTLVKVRTVLIPHGFEHGFNALTCPDDRLGHYHAGVGLQEFHLLLIVIEPELHVLGQ